MVGVSERPAVVLDVGSARTKAGFAGEVRPAVDIPSSVVLDDGIDPGGQAGPTWPTKDGIVQNWDAMECLWLEVFYKRMRVYPEDQAVLLTEQALTTPETREHAAEILFESLDVPRLHIAQQPQLALYADYALRQGEAGGGALTGLVVESGDGPTHITPLVDGYLLTPGCRTLPTGGALVTAHLVVDAVQACPIDTRRALLSNIILSGGNTMFKGFAQRLESEVHACLHARNMTGAVKDVHVTARPGRKQAVWLGGSILAASDAFGAMAVTRQAYEESGPSLFHGRALAVEI